jgi:hypothetical protein
MTQNPDIARRGGRPTRSPGRPQPQRRARFPQLLCVIEGTMRTRDFRLDTNAGSVGSRHTDLGTETGATEPSIFELRSVERVQLPPRNDKA